MMNAKLFILAALSLQKSIVFNFRVLPLSQAMKMPFLIHYRTKVICARGGVQLDCPVSPLMIKMGFGGTISVISNRHSMISLEKDSNTVFHGKTMFGEGFSLRNKGTISFGKNFSVNKNGIITCADSITFGDNDLLGWNVVVRDADGHPIIENGVEKNTRKPVSIGNHVWICAESHILKGSKVPDDCVVGYRSLVNKQFNTTNSIIAGSPASVVKEQIEWKY